ncbi:hypothetical protein PENNAL_c0041G11086 [Penicillium nalgiovense]|uniref:Uncharacterized protein n=1 Tax=Penicillium nalgiovense TaxID=60175 RepID=A0A1V6Y2B7_PENNA|nr:hypothetical protein PENNAL_c0041G11086 [Penicillium nalgiovense]
MPPPKGYWILWDSWSSAARRYGHSAVCNLLQQFSTGSNTQDTLQFTDAPGRHFRTASLQEVVAENGFRLL